MGKAWIAIGVVLVTLVAGAMGYTIASAVLTFKALGFSADIDFGYIAQNYLWIRDRRPDDFQLINLIIGGAAVAGLMMSLALSGSARECHELCVSGLAHAGFRYSHALKRSSNIMAK